MHQLDALNRILWLSLANSLYCPCRSPRSANAPRRAVPRRAAPLGPM
eukprot:IDg19710t1